MRLERHLRGGELLLAPSRLALEERPAPVDFDRLYRDHFHDCCRWLCAMGIPESDLEDVAQEVFLVARRKLRALEVRSPGAWLYGIAWRTASDHRRRAWWKNLFRRDRGIAIDGFADGGEGPPQAVERAERTRMARRCLDRLSPTLRATLVLFEIEGLRGEEIASLQGVPLKTVWTRLHRARKEFAALAEAERRAEASLEDRGHPRGGGR